MKHEFLTGYLLHARPYQEKRAIYTFFSQECGVVQGVGSRGVPLFTLIQLFATGKNSLKSFSQIVPVSLSLPYIHGQPQYALLYLNEVLCRLIAPEMPCPDLFDAYEVALSMLFEMGEDDKKLKMALRQFEYVLFNELGALPSFDVDISGEPIDPDALYLFDPVRGFVLSDEMGICGNAIIAMSSTGNCAHLNEKGRIYRQILDILLDHKPLNSRKLWQQSLQYKEPNQ